MNSASPRTIRAALLAAAVGGVVGLGAVVADYMRELAREDRAVPPGTETAIGGPFTLLDAAGNTVTEADFAGRPLLVFFGFTHCPHVCPATLARLSGVLRELGPQGDALTVAFITVDPERDTPKRLREYRAPFDPRIRYLTGTPAQIAATAQAYGVSYAKVALPDGDYTMDHTAALYLMDARNRLAESFAGVNDAARIARAVRAHL